MENRHIQMLTDAFEGCSQQTDNGVEFWLARNLQLWLGYGKWDNFQSVILKAKTACEISGHEVVDHFADVGKMIELGKGGQREIDDVMVTRYACYPICANRRINIAVELKHCSNPVSHGGEYFVRMC